MMIASRDPDGAAGLADEAGAVQDAHARSDRDVAAQRLEFL
jgi:hypothetical protein